MPAKSLTLTLACLCALVSFSYAQQYAKSTEPAFKTVHLFNLPSAQSELQLLAVLKDCNQLFQKLGYLHVQYRLWKVEGKREGDRSYLWESTWPDKITYDQIHQNKDFLALAEKLLTIYYLMDTAS
jgi:hypothetical protein